MAFTKQLRYKQFLSAAFLLLYIFIAAPIQLWHHHDAAQQSKPSATKILKQSESNTQAGECKICQHTYTSYLNDETHVGFDEIDFPSVKKPAEQSGCNSSFVNGLSNKGPPTQSC